MSDMDFSRPYAHVYDLGAVKWQQDGMYFLMDGSLFDGDPATGIPTHPVQVKPKVAPKKGAPDAALTRMFSEGEDVTA